MYAYVTNYDFNKHHVVINWVHSKWNKKAIQAVILTCVLHYTYYCCACTAIAKKTYEMQRSYSWIYSKLLFLLAPPGMVPSHIRNSKVTWHVYPSFSVNWICTAKHYALTLHLHWKAIHSHSFEWRWWCWCLWGTFTKYVYFDE